MLTLFTTAKPFVGHSAVIQRNALESWRRLDGEIEIIVVGDEPGVAEICREMRFGHVTQVECKRNGTKTVRSVFAQAQQMARYQHVCYCNCDIVLTADFAQAFRNIRSTFPRFLMIGRRWDVDVTQPMDFSAENWQEKIVEHAQRHGFQRFHYNIDYFLFPRGLYQEIPELVIGRNHWDQWLVWFAGSAGVPVVDASAAVCAVHQNHDYSYHPQGMQGVWNDEATQANFLASGGWKRLHTIEDANWRLTRVGLSANRWYRLAPARRKVRRIIRGARGFLRTQLWHPLLGATRPARRALGLREGMFKALRWRTRGRRHWLDQ
jgi:hypothetical protein